MTTCDVCDKKIQGTEITKIQFPFGADAMKEDFDFEVLCSPCGFSLYKKLIDLKNELIMIRGMKN